MVKRRTIGTGTLLVGLVACSGGDAHGGLSGFGSGANPGGSGSSNPTATGGGGGADDDAGASGASGATEAADEGGPIFDVATPEETGAPSQCQVGGDGLDAPPPCVDTAPPDSFEPVVQWAWDPPHAGGDFIGSKATPLVANLTDDNGDGRIDLCDTPDIIVSASGGKPDPDRAEVHLYALDGETGAQHWVTAERTRGHATPALGDIDGDGRIEIVAAGDGRGLQVFEHDGSLKWAIDDPVLVNFDTVSLADVDLDGDVEIIAGASLLDHEGNVEWTLTDEAQSGALPAAVAVDLDGDDQMEIVLGRSAVRADGSDYYRHPTLQPGFPQVADFDADGEPEILVVNVNGLSMIEHDGTLTFADVNASGVDLASNGLGPWFRPAAVHDFDGDGRAEFSVSSREIYGVYEADMTAHWMAAVIDESGRATGTAFDFIGDGVADAIYADERELFVFDGDGQRRLSLPRSSPTIIEYPVVADVDNDGSAEIVVVSAGFQGRTSPTVQVIRDVEDRWIPARRIWNQHTYHVTNIREDGTIPSPEPKHWLGLNTFRTQAQVTADGGVCRPEG